MSWLAILLSLAALGGSATPSKAPVRKHRCTADQHAKTCKVKPKKKAKAKVKPRAAPTPTPAPKSSAPGSQRGDSPSSKADPEATPVATATPKPGATPTVTPTPTATPVYPRRTGVDLDEWLLRSSYRTLAAGSIDFNAANLGEDDHNLSVRGGGREYGRLELRPGDAETLTLELGPGSYTLYCSLIGHEAAGMRTEITVR